MRAALIGDGIGPSLTPALHTAEGQALGFPYRYDRIDTTEAPWRAMPLGEIIGWAQAEGYAGLNITHPHKAAACALVEALSGVAADIGSINTITFEGGRRTGFNTDYTGFSTALAEADLPVRGKQIVQFGAGGAGSATALALIDAGASLTVIDTVEARAKSLVSKLQTVRPGASVDGGTNASEALKTAEGTVNATPLGMASHPGMAFEPADLKPSAWVAELVYFPLETALLQKARAKGLRTLSGKSMALYQAVEAFALITGHSPDRDRMRRTLDGLLAETPP
ncbi:MAG: shikimate dehydrogenase [Devosiaceae bacterium]|nr:shikimate dehydrogenase [Devosiaceae bacterium MH13]